MSTSAVQAEHDRQIVKIERLQRTKLVLALLMSVLLAVATIGYGLLDWPPATLIPGMFFWLCYENISGQLRGIYRAQAWALDLSLASSVDKPLTRH